MITNAQTSGINVDKKELKALMRRNDRTGILYLVGWFGLMAISGSVVMLTLSSWWIVPAMLLHSIFFAVPTYAFSHECAHGTAFRTRWLNESVFWVTSLLYFEEPLHRRYAHASHHTHTWIEEEDAQMPYAAIPLTIWGWVEEVLGLGLYWHQIKMFFAHSFGHFSDEVRRVTPDSELPRMKRSTQICLAVYLTLAAVSILSGWLWLLLLIVLPRVIGGPIMNMFILMQHVEMAENQPNIVKSTRSFETNWFGRFLYCNMNFHIEHHLYPTVPFHALPDLSVKLSEQLPEPDPGFFQTNWEVLKVVMRRTLLLDDRSKVIRQAPQHMPRDSVEEATT